MRCEPAHEPPDWPICSLDEICTSISSGGTPKRAKADRYFSTTGHSWVKTKELRDSFVDDTEEHITDAALQESAARLYPPNTVLIAIYAAPTVGRLGLLRVPAACNQACAALQVDPERANNRFVFFALVGHRHRLHQIASGSAQQNINVGIVRSFSFPLPKLDDQRRIAGVLAALDDKIEANRQLAQTLEEIAATLFRARFVDCVGVEELEDSELGPIPVGWEVSSLDSIARFVNGGAFTKHANEAGLPIIRIRELNQGLRPDTPRSDIEAKPDQRASHFDLLFSWSGSLDVYRWTGPEVLINQHIFKVVPEGCPSWCVEGWLRHHLQRFQAIAQDKATTMGHIKRHHLRDARIALAPKGVIAATDEQLAPLLAQRSSTLAEQTPLIALRDTLLPKLISGQMRVSDTYDPNEILGPAIEAETAPVA